MNGNNSSTNGVKVFGIVLIVIGALLFVIGACTGTITGYQGANGLYYSDYNAVGSNEWMCVPGLILAVIGFVITKIAKGLK